MQPNGTHLAPAGSILVDETGETIVTIMMGDPRIKLEDTPTYRFLYRHPPERVSTSTLSGNLYRRTRAADGGAWDGWFLAVPRGQKTLYVTASYTGSSAAAFNRLRDDLLTISWDESIADPEVALGVKLLPTGLHLVTGMFGGLSYNETGRLGATGPALLLLAIPVPPYKANAMFPSGCQQLLSAAFGSKGFAGPKVRENKTIRWCEAWSDTTESEMRYVALIRLPSGALISVMGTASSSRFQELLSVFRSAVANLQPLPRP